MVEVYGWLLANLPTLFRAVVPFIPLLVALINRIPTERTDRVEERMRKIHEAFEGKTVKQIARMGRTRQWKDQNPYLEGD